MKFVFFDIGYTIVNEDAVWAQRCCEQAQTAEARLLGLTPEIIFSEIVKATKSYRPQYRTVVKKFNLTSQAPYRHELEELYKDAEMILHSLSRKYRLGVIANQTDGLVGRLDKWGIADYFSVIISSWDYQIMKPDIRLFKAALEKAGCEPREAVMVGDRLDNDIRPAKSIGMRTIWVKQGFGGLQSPETDDFLPDEKVDSLSELLRIL